jgi:hypothetical protein
MLYLATGYFSILFFSEMFSQDIFLTYIAVIGEKTLNNILWPIIFYRVGYFAGKVD